MNLLELLTFFLDELHRMVSHISRNLADVNHWNRLIMLLGRPIGLLEEPLDLCPLLVLRAEVGWWHGSDGTLIVTHVIVIVGGDALGLMGLVFGLLFDEVFESLLVDFTHLGLGA